MAFKGYLHRQYLIAIFYKSVKLNFSFLTLCLTLCLKINAQTSLVANEHIIVYSHDSIAVHLFLFHQQNNAIKNAPVILLYHHALSNTLSENRAIVPKLLSMGYNLVLTDLRIGMTGEHGGINLTAEGWKNKSYDDYCIAMADMEASWQYVKSRFPENKKIIWGSGYTASLAIQLSVLHPNDFTAGLAFAPAQNGPVEQCEPTANILQKITIPIVAFRAETEMDDNRRQQADLFKVQNIDYHIIPSNQHGSSVLDASRNPESYEKVWTIVTEFLQKI